MRLLEGGQDALVFASGVGDSATLLQVLEPGSHVIFPQDVYVHVRVAHQEFLPKWLIQSSVVDMESPESVERALEPNTKLVWVETPSNPRMNIADIAAIAKIAHAAGALVLVDNTFATPVLQQPFELGADIVLHSTTKYCGGHSDVQGGCLVLKEGEPLYKKLLHPRPVLGAGWYSLQSWVLLLCLRSAAVR